MATPPAAPAPGNGGGNHLGLRLSEHKVFSIQSQQLALIVVLLVVGFLAWERGKTTAKHLDRLDASLASLSTAIPAGDAALEAVVLEQVRALREALLTRQVAIQQASSEERAALSQALAAHGQQSQAAYEQMQQCSAEMAGVLSLLRQRGVGP
jgi:hypothetical protein